MRSVSQASTAAGGLPKHRAGGLSSAITSSAERASSVRLPEDVLFTQHVVLGGLHVVVVASTRTVRAVVLTDGGTTLIPPQLREQEVADGFVSPVASVADLGGGVASMHAVTVLQHHSQRTAAGSNGAVHRALVAVGTTHGAVRILALEASSGAAASSTSSLRIGFRVLATVSLAEVSAHQISSSDTVISVAWICPPASSPSLFPEGLVVATRTCVLGISLGGLEGIFVGGGAVGSSHVFVPRRAHCSLHNDTASVVRVLPLPTAGDAFGGASAQFRAGSTSSSVSSSSLNSVADHCLACIIVHDNGAVRYLVRHLAADAANPSNPSSSTSRGALSFSYRLCTPTCTAMADALQAASSVQHSSLVVVNDATFKYDEVSNSLHLVLCGVEVSEPSGSTALNKGATPTTTNSTVFGPRGGVSTSSFFAAPSGSTYAFSSQSPYAHKVAWWGIIRDVVPLGDLSTVAQQQQHLAHFTLPLLMQNRHYVPLVESVVSSWAAAAEAKAAPVPQRQSTATPVDRRGFASCAGLQNHTSLLTMGCELHLGSNNNASSSSSTGNHNTGSDFGPSAAQLLFTFATAISTFTTVGGVVNTLSTSHPDAAVQRVVVGSGNSLHLLLLTAPR